MTDRRAGRDAVTLEVIRNALPAIANEMSHNLQRTSYNMMIYEVRDYCCALLAPDGRLISQNVGGVSHFVSDLGGLSLSFRIPWLKRPSGTCSPENSLIMQLSSRASTLTPSLTLSIDSKAKTMKSEGIDVCGFGAGEPDFDTPEHIKAAAIAALQAGFTKYTPSSGIPELRQAVADKFLLDNGIDYKPSQIIISDGAKHSCYNAILATCQPGDEVIIPAPYWLSYPEMVRLAGADPVFSTSFKIGETCAAVLGGIGVAVCDIWELKTGRSQKVSIDVRHAAAGLRSCIYMQRPGPDGAFKSVANKSTEAMLAITQPWPTKDGRWVLPHFGLPNLQARMQKLLGCELNPVSVAKAVAKWDALDLEAAIDQARVCGGMVRRCSARNCWPYSLCNTHEPTASTYSPAVTVGTVPTTVTTPRRPPGWTRSTANPVSGLWEVTRSTTPDRVSAMIAL